MSNMTPREIVEELNRHIVGQDDAKRAVAIALRNRWRRMQLPESLQSEVTPKNILMIGPTGVGKTEIARRLAKLANAPFIKVEATKFTEVGYVGRDVESIIRDLTDSAIKMIREAEASPEPLYVLIWGPMYTLRDALYKRPDLVSKFRVLTIASDRHYDGNCTLENWNAGGRRDIFNDSRFNNLWWVESNWTYNGMFTGSRPAEMLNTLSGYGSLGWFLKDVVKNFSWAQYFRAGDTPTVMYLIDPNNNLNNPAQGSWAGQFTRPFSNRPNYYTDVSGGVNWDYANPCNTWGQKAQVYNNSKATLEVRRESMYSALINKLNRVYGRN